MPETPDGRVALRCGGQRQGMAGGMTMIENLGLAFRVAHTAGEDGHSVVSSRACFIGFLEELCRAEE